MSLQTELMNASKRLRKLADAIDGFFTDFKQENNQIANKIINNGIERIAGEKIKIKRKKLHWTQRPENKAKMMKNIKRALRNK